MHSAKRILTFMVAYCLQCFIYLNVNLTDMSLSVYVEAADKIWTIDFTLSSCVAFA